MPKPVLYILIGVSLVGLVIVGAIVSSTPDTDDAKPIVKGPPLRNADCLTPAERDYYAAAWNAMDTFERAREWLVSLLPGPRTDQWTVDVIEALYRIESAAARLRDIEPAPDSLTEMHAANAELADAIEAWARQMEIGIIHYDLSLAVVYDQKVLDASGRVGVLIDEFCPRRDP